MNFSRNILKNFLAICVTQGVNLLSPLFLTPLFLHHWSPEVFGEWLVLTAIPNYLMLYPDLGITGALNNAIAICGLEDDKAKARRLYSTTILAVGSVCIGVVALAALVIFAVDWVSLLRLHSISLADSRWILLLSCSQVLFMIFSQAQVGCYRFIDRNARASAIEMGMRLFAFCGGVALLLGGFSCRSYAFFLFGAGVLKALVMALDSGFLLPWLRVQFRGNHFRELLAYLKPGLGNLGLAWCGSLQSQGILIALQWATGSATDVAIYQSAFTVTSLLTIPNNTAWSAVYPELALMHLRLPLDRLTGYIAAINRILNLTVCLLIVLVLWFREPICRIWLDNAVSLPFLLLLPLAILYLPDNLFSILIYLFYAGNLNHRIVPWILAGNTLTVLAVYLCGRLWGLAAVGFPILAGESLLTIFLTRYAVRLHLATPDLFWQAIRPALPWRDLASLRGI